MFPKTNETGPENKKGYKVSTDRNKDDINKRTDTLAQKLTIENKMEQHTTTTAFVTLKGHKDNLSTNEHCRVPTDQSSQVKL